MKTLLWSFCLLGLGMALHLVLWRVRLPRRQTRTLLVLLFGVPAVSLIALDVFGPSLGDIGGFAPVTPGEHLRILLFCYSMALAYTITYSGIEADSPTLVMLLAIDRAGPGGLPEAEFHARLTDEVLVLPRLRDLVRDGLATYERGLYAITPKGRRFVGLFAIYRGLMGAPLKGG